jgi:hypothetical protein
MEQLTSSYYNSHIPNVLSFTKGLVTIRLPRVF